MLYRSNVRRSLNIALAAVMFLSALAPLVLQHKAFAYGQITAREIKMSTSAVSASSTSYDVKFTAGTTATIKGIVVDFCSNSPILGDTCSGTVGTNVPNISASPAITITSGITATWTAGQLNSNRTLTLTKAAGDALTAGSTVVDFTITTVTNPSATGTFYARVYTFPNDTTSNDPSHYTPTNLGTNIPTDAGGIAMSTVAQITVTAKVQERLTFCVYTSAINYTTCGSGTSVALGDTNGVLDPAGPYVDKTAKYNVSTNATNGVTIRLKGATLTSGSNTIAPIGASAAASTSGSEQFGLCTYRDTGGGAAGLTAASPYDDVNCSSTTQTAGTGSTGGNGTAQFAYDTTNLATTYGQSLATKTAGNLSTGIIALIGNISNTTAAGIYTATLTLVATGNY